jgi:predicted double-glycine peptidase
MIGGHVLSFAKPLTTGVIPMTKLTWTGSLPAFVRVRFQFGLLLAIGAVCIASTQADTAERVRSLKEIREEGVIIQQWDTSCAAAALATVFTYTHGDPVSEQTVAQGMLRYTEPLRVRYRGGFSLLDMKRYAEERGYVATGYLGFAFEDIVLFEGAIVPLNLYGYNHYVVFKGVADSGDVWLADPAFGNRYMSRERFEDVWIDGMAFVVSMGTNDEVETPS